MKNLSQSGFTGKIFALYFFPLVWQRSTAMAELNSKQWYTEIFAPSSSAFSLRISDKLAEVQSPFQKIEIYRTTDFGNMMVIDDVIMLSARENFLYHEMLSHPVLFTHPNPQNVVIIGGGDCGTLREVLKHSTVQAVTQIDIDEQVTRMAEQFFPELCASNQDPRATLLFDDGIKYMREAAPASLDVIIVDSTDPIGPGEGLFNRAFYQSCFQALKPGGILVQQSESPLIHLALLNDMRVAMHDAGFAALQTLQFPQMVYPSGWWTCTLARKDAGFDGFRRADAEQAPFATEYYNADIHQAAMALPNFLKRELKPAL